MVLVFLFIGRFLCFDAGALCGAAGPTNGRLAPSHADVARVIRLMLSAVLKSSRTTSVWLLAWPWPPACRFAAAPNLPSPGSSNRHADRKSTRLNSSHLVISYAVFCLKKKKNNRSTRTTQSTTNSVPFAVCKSLWTLPSHLRRLPSSCSRQLTHGPLLLFFFFNDTATTEIYTLSLHDALPISPPFTVTATASSGLAVSFAST